MTGMSKEIRTYIGKYFKLYVTQRTDPEEIATYGPWETEYRLSLVDQAGAIRAQYEVLDARVLVLVLLDREDHLGELRVRHLLEPVPPQEEVLEELDEGLRPPAVRLVVHVLLHLLLVQLVDHAAHLLGRESLAALVLLRVPQAGAALRVEVWRARPSHRG